MTDAASYEEFLKKSVNLITPQDDIKQKREHAANIRQLYHMVEQLSERIRDQAMQTEKYQQKKTEKEVLDTKFE